ncbi:MAG: RHS repeat-associated core domain-containing protein [Bacteroidales bacterium]|nr:RHS repeat-associated core domain-containing protein [Bacteroidales bacterium]MDD4209676.1 RHS repeat-associated core domain-containing protein [Bacteroidales bacterium]
MKNYSVKNKNYCVNNEKYCVNKLIYCVNNFGFDIQPFGCAQLASPQGSLNFVNPYPDLCNLQGNAQETELFYYHPDHLGSTGMVTDNLSNITAGYLYAPFGEILQEHSAVDNRIPKYAFNAKELDEENGMYYYSARYYAPPTFISRDPMFEKYPSISPYTYCANNPVRLVDPNGKAPIDRANRYIKRHNLTSVKIENGPNNSVWIQYGLPGLSGVAAKNFKENVFDRIINKIKTNEAKRLSYKEQTNQVGTVLSTKKADYNQQGPAIETKSTDLIGGSVYTNVDNMPLGVPNKNTGSILNFINNAANAFESGYNTAEGVENAVKSKSLDPEEKVSVPYYKRNNDGSWTGGEQKALRKDSANVSQELNN